jgi:hypothetical protein
MFTGILLYVVFGIEKPAFAVPEYVVNDKLLFVAVSPIAKVTSADPPAPVVRLDENSAQTSYDPTDGGVNVIPTDSSPAAQVVVEVDAVGGAFVPLHKVATGCDPDSGYNVKVEFVISEYGTLVFPRFGNPPLTTALTYQFCRSGVTTSSEEDGKREIDIPP